MIKHLLELNPVIYGSPHTCIVMLDPQTGNVFVLTPRYFAVFIFVLIYGVGVQHCTSFIWFPKGLRTNRQIDIKSQNSRRRPDGLDLILS